LRILTTFALMQICEPYRRTFIHAVIKMYFAGTN